MQHCMPSTRPVWHINPLECKGSYSATINTMKLVYWPLMGWLLHLVQRGEDWRWISQKRYETETRFQWNTHTLHMSVISNDLEWHSKIFSDDEASRGLSAIVELPVNCASVVYLEPSALSGLMIFDLLTSKWRRQWHCHDERRACKPN